jgi:hypothetical protein
MSAQLIAASPGQPRPKRRLRADRLSVALLASALALTACGSSSRSSSTNATGTASGSYSQGVKFADCMRSHGVPSFPDPKFTSQSGGNLLPAFSSSTCKLPTTSPAFLAAVKLCPSGLGGNLALAFIRAQQQHGAACAQ